MTACPSIEFPDSYSVRAVEISGQIEYPEVDGFTWAGPIELIGESVTGAPVTQPSDPVVVAVCATPVSSPNSASALPSIHDSAWIMPPDDRFAITFLYASEMSPNSPDGRFAEAGPMTQKLAFPSVITDCAALNTTGFTAQDGGFCTIQRTTDLSG